MSKVVAQTSTFPLRKMELLSTELRLLKAAIVQLHDRFDLLLAEMTELQHEYAESSADAREYQLEKDQEHLTDRKFIEQSEHEELSADTAPPQEPRSLSECLALLKCDRPAPTEPCIATFPSSVSIDDGNSKNEDALVATESIVESSQTEIAMASPVDLLEPQARDATSTTAAQSALSNQPEAATERPPSLIPPPDVMTFRAHRGRPMSRRRLFARRASVAAALATIITFAIAYMSPLPVLIEYAETNSP